MTNHLNRSRELLEITGSQDLLVIKDVTGPKKDRAAALKNKVATQLHYQLEQKDMFENTTCVGIVGIDPVKNEDNEISRFAGRWRFDAKRSHYKVYDRDNIPDFFVNGLWSDKELDWLSPQLKLCGPAEWNGTSATTKVWDIAPGQEDYQSAIRVEHRIKTTLRMHISTVLRSLANLKCRACDLMDLLFLTGLAGLISDTLAEMKSATQSKLLDMASEVRAPIHRKKTGSIRACADFGQPKLKDKDSFFKVDRDPVPKDTVEPVPFSDVYQVKPTVACKWTMSKTNASPHASRGGSIKRIALISERPGSSFPLHVKTGIQHGEASTDGRDVGLYRGTMDHEIDIPIPFPSSYQKDEDPEVVCWLTKVDSGSARNHRVKGFPRNISKNGFTLRFFTWWDTLLYGATAQWVAFSKNRNDLCGSNKPYAEPQFQTAGADLVWTFDRQFEKTHSIFFALNCIDLDCTKDARIRSWIKESTAEKVVLRVETWDDSRMWAAGVSCIAIAMTSVLERDGTAQL
ncbi:hypothetical protein H2199_002520 [Coniosporium tulheliwenetii]|uniref:Uncharacterized protein n=1 Tax=Coniosporium tulheliwenetii TaxID=3383036 RepID=A0ACC2ZFB9_9PEZI|nr:hypothetical protein H2199_002520 [Cladosporium sp. JES 115]